MTDTVPTIDWSLAARHDVEQFMHDEFLGSLPSIPDRDALIRADRAIYLLHQTIAYEYAAPGARPSPTIDGHASRTPRGSTATRPPLRRPGARQKADPQAGRSLRQCRGPCQRARRRRGDRIPHEGGPRPQPNIGSSVAVEWRHHDGHAPHPARRGDPEAARSLGPVRDAIETADAIADLVNSSFEYAHGATSVRTTAADAWKLRRGVCQDMAHVMIAMCSSLGIASRYVSGHLVGDGASHAWTEVFDPARNLAVAIDPTHRRRTDLRYITTATGRDYRDVAPTSGTYSGRGGQGTLRVNKVVRLVDVG